MENGFEIKKRGIKEWRIWRDRRRRREEGKDRMREQNKETEGIFLVPLIWGNQINMHRLKLKLTHVSFRSLSLPVELPITVCPPLQADRQGQSSGKYQVTMTSIGTKCTGTKVSCLCLMLSSTLVPICTVLWLPYSNCTVLLNDYSARLVMPEHKSLFGSPR